MTNSKQIIINEISKVIKAVFEPLTLSLSNETCNSLAEVIYSLASIRIKEEKPIEKYELKECILFSPIPNYWNKQDLYEAYIRFQKCTNSQIDCEGFINGFAWALSILQGEKE